MCAVGVIAYIDVRLFVASKSLHMNWIASGALESGVAIVTNSLFRFTFGASMLLSISLMGGLAFGAEVPSIQEPLATGHDGSSSAAAVLFVEDYRSMMDVAGAEASAAFFSSVASATLGITEANVVPNTRSDRRGLRAAVRKAASRVGDGGTLWVYFVGHGVVTDEGWYLLGSSASGEGGDAAANGISMDEVVEWTGRGGAVATVVVADSVFGGAERPYDPGEAAISLWASDESYQTSHRWTAADERLFTWLAAAGMRGWADGVFGERDGQVTLEEAKAWVRDTSARLGSMQRPVEALGGVDAELVLSSGDLEPGPSAEDWTSFNRMWRGGRVNSAIERALADGTARFDEAMAIEDAAERQRALQAFVENHQRVTVQLEVGIHLPEVMEARRALRELANPPAVAEAAPAASTEASTDASAPAATSTPVPPVPPPNVSCDNLLQVEPFALMGRLSPDLMACLEARLVASEVQTEKADISRVLMVNADAKRDGAELLRLLARHLEDLDRSDPDLCFTYAVALSREGLDRAPEVIRWANYALENKQEWNRNTYTRRLVDLYRLRAETANKLWEHHDAVYVETRTDEASADAETWRGHTKQFSREWLDYAEAAEQDRDRARQLCITAAGTADFCEETNRE